MIRSHFLLSCLALTLLACHPSADEPSDTPSEQASEQASEAAPVSPADELERIDGLLRARHADDLPSAEQLAAYPNAEASLRELASHGDTMMIRTRALTLLRHYGSPETGVLLGTLLADPSAHPALRAAALTGLAGQPLDDRPEQLELARAALRDDDPRVGRAAVELLGNFEAGRRVLDEARSDSALPEATRKALDPR